MAREEQIINAAKNYYKDSALKDLKIFHFINGANWADNNPKEGLVSIDKVCKWLQKYFVEDHYGMSPSGFCAFAAMFKKAMED